MQQVNTIPENDREARIEKMYREKQERIARQIALRVARETVALATATAIKDPVVTASKVIEVAEMYLKWLRGGNDNYSS
ncbi:hypothetical protein [Archaeoglobus veneficus]|uniref:Uncharacterized protein n=1 Tax=Archaeoglobus veneficus (strain DSM 11195 / SNP6) TaxID=693661 RepID=F2KS14_ARCVS|nr:hypothetical protein [Archaeoglobus veneficus]AEA46855.1 hypothetical protein Arcve_0840 [Archaeoglobus veneficus SNP6]